MTSADASSSATPDGVPSGPTRWKPFWVKAGNIYTTGTMWFRAEDEDQNDITLDEDEVDEIFEWALNRYAEVFDGVLDGAIWGDDV